MPPEGATLLVNGPTRARSDSSPNIKRTYGRGAGAGHSRIAGMLAIVVVATALAAAVATMSTGAPAPPVYQLTSTPTPPTPPTPLIPNDHGYARVTAPSQTISCSISAELVANLPLRETRTLYSQWGDWFAWLNLLGLAACLAFALQPSVTQR